MEHLTEIETQLLCDIVDDHPDRMVLREQISLLHVLRKESSDIDMQYEFCHVPESVARTKRLNQTITGKEVLFKTPDVLCAVNLYIENGVIVALEIVSHADKIPRNFNEYRVIPTQNIV
ncbi:MAG: hypothetical protein WCK15_04735 [Pirellula sp.]|jgi:hypothetical protein